MSDERVTVTLRGQTSLVTSYVKRDDRSRPPRKENQVFTLKNTLQRMKDVVTVHSLLARGYPAYWITATYPAGMDLKERVARFGKFCDAVRKLPHYAGHVWVRELHPGKDGRTAQTGTVHMHMLLRVFRPWFYKGVVVEWSTRYNGSVNGLHIRKLEVSVEAYMTKVRNDIKKARHLNYELPVRWWGTSKLVREVEVVGGVPWRVYDMQGRRQTYATVPKWFALAVVEKATREYELRQWRKRMLALTGRKSKPKKAR